MSLSIKIWARLEWIASPDGKDDILKFGVG